MVSIQQEGGSKDEHRQRVTGPGRGRRSRATTALEAQLDRGSREVTRRIGSMGRLDGLISIGSAKEPRLRSVGSEQEIL
jgi:hypothetical protein